MNKLKQSTILIFIVSLLFSCRNNDNSTTPLAPDEIYTEETVSSGAFTNLSSLVNQNAVFSNSFGGRLETSALGFYKKYRESVNSITDNTCAVVKYEESSLSITIDYGDGCEVEGSFISGRITSTISDYSISLTAISLKMTVETENFFIDGTEISGTQVITSTMSLDGGTINSINQTTVLKRGRITFPNKKTIAREGTWADVITFNEHTEEDMQISRTGTSSGTNSGGTAYTSTITKALVMDSKCKLKDIGFFPQSGTVSITLTARGDNIILDYGNGTCDETATVTTAKQSREITLSEIKKWLLDG